LGEVVVSTFGSIFARTAAGALPQSDSSAILSSAWIL
jgi:hypothetical protein